MSHYYKGLVSKNTLKACFDKAKENGALYIGVTIKTEGYPGNEVIINGIENFDSKLEYYMNAYNDNLTLKKAPDKVSIIAFGYGNSFRELSRLMI